MWSCMAVSARDAMDRQGRLSIAVKAVDRVPAIRNHPALGGDYVAASTMGTGSGIPADKIDQIIEAFFATKGGGQRTGLGLSQVFGFAKQPSGEIQVERRKDVGTAFTLFLPSFAATARVIRAEHVTASLGKKRPHPRPRPRPRRQCRRGIVRDQRPCRAGPFHGVGRQWRRSARPSSRCGPRPSMPSSRDVAMSGI